MSEAAADTADTADLAVALVVPGDPATTSGGFRYDRRLVAGLRDRGASVRVFSVPWRRYPFGVVDTLGLATGLPAGLTDADVVVVDELAHPGTAGLVRRLRRGGTPVVALVHHLRRSEGGPLAPVAARLERAFLRGCSAAVCVSEATEREVRRLAGASLRTHVAPPAADQFAPDVSPAAVDRRATAEPFRVVSVGALVPRKGHPTLLRALAGLDAVDDADAADGAAGDDRATTDWRLAVVGPEPDADHAAGVRRLAADLGVADRVTFRGELPSADLAATLRRSHVFALPSRYEGFGIASLEGMGFGLPAVASAAGGAGSVVTDGADGVLVAPGDVAAVRDALAGLAADRERLAAMGRAALARFAAHPPWTETVAGVAGFLGDVAGDAAPSRPTTPEVADGG